MYKNLVEQAKSEGIECIVVEALIQKKGKMVLLIEDLNALNPFYELPAVNLKIDETIPQALQRAVTTMTAMQIKEVMAYLGHSDGKQVRHYYFLVEVSDPYSVEENTQLAHAWIGVNQAMGYPIRETLRDILDRYAVM